MKNQLKNTISFYIFILICTLWAGIFMSLPEFIDNPSDGFIGFLIISFHWALILTATFFVLSIAAINKYVFSVFLVLFSLFGAILAFYRYAYKATLTPTLIDASIHNDLGTTMDVISFQLLAYVILNIVISVFFIRYRFKNIHLEYKIFHFVFSLLVLSLFFGVNDRLKASLLQRFPFSIYHNLVEYNKLKVDINKVKVNPDPNTKFCEADSLTVVLVLGESLRADHVGLNGYARQTTPKLNKRENVYSLRNIYSEYTNTNRSLPHILTRADSANTELAFEETSFISIFKQCGYTSAWISSQDPANTYMSFINECDTVVYAHPEKSVYNYNNWLDEDLLEYTAFLLAKNNPRNLFVLHTIGSHWYYNNHFSEKYELFKPITTSRIITQNSSEQIINSYDNTIVYTDFFLDQLIAQLENKNALIIYISDHGEVLGENGAWLHAGDNAASKKPACFVWFSDNFAESYPEKINALKTNKDKYYRTDMIFHSILDGGTIQSPIIDRKLNIFN
jgi:glucan phosphoethanolaminetransferase (alkaline phosphatase superfamily)